ALQGSKVVAGPVGNSYLGWVQYYAAPTRPPHLKAMCPVSGPVTYFENCVYRRGVFELAWMLTYFTFMARDTLARKGIYDREGPILDGYLAHPDIPISPLKPEEFLHLPISDWAERLGKGAPYFADYLRHWKQDAYWNETDLRTRCDNVATPVLHV